MLWHSCSSSPRRLRANPSTMLGLVILLLMACSGTAKAQSQRLIVHEWGVLTAIAQEDGSLLSWSPLEGAPPQPSFIQQYNASKAAQGNVRIDIPAIYFRVDQPTSLTMNLEFLRGYFFSGYPRATCNDYSVTWPGLTLLPRDNMPLLTEPTASRYYQLRNTACSQVRVDHAGHKQFERFIHLRGAGNIPLPLSVQVDHEEFHVQGGHASAKLIKQVIAIENQQGKIGFSVVDMQDGQARFARPKLTANIDLATARLRRLLNQQGMYPDQANAIIATAQPEWFEPGTRLIYLMPLPILEETFKLRFQPAPSEHVRLYAVRVELITPQMRQHLLDRLALVSLDKPNTYEPLIGSSTLVRPILRQLHAESADEAVKRTIAGLLKDENLP